MCLLSNVAFCQEGGKACLLKVDYDSTAGSPFSVMGERERACIKGSGLLVLVHDTGSFIASGF